MLKVVIDCIAFAMSIKLPSIFRHDEHSKKGKDIGAKHQKLEVTAVWGVQGVSLCTLCIQFTKTRGGQCKQLAERGLQNPTNPLCSLCQARRQAKISYISTD